MENEITKDTQKNSKNIYEKLMEARILLQEKNLKKSGYNEYALFKYFELADFLPAINLIFRDLRLYSMFSITPGNMATLTIINIDNTQESLSFQSPMVDSPIKGSPAIQSLGAAHTYLKRYLYQNALEIVESDQVDARVGASSVDEIENIKDVVELNRIYLKYSDWKVKLKEKATKIGAAYCLSTSKFEQISSVSA
jgi:hypothetical protein